MICDEDTVLSSSKNLNMKKKKHRPQKSSKTKQKKVSKKADTQVLTSSGGTEPSKPLTCDGTESSSQWDRWRQLEDTLRQRDIHHTGSVHLEDWRRGLLEFGASVSKSELHILTQKLKTTDNTINYQDLSTQIQQLRIGDLDSQTEDVSNEKIDPKERFIRLRVCMLPFDWPTHPGSFEVVLSVKRPLLALMEVIQERVGIRTSQLKIFRNRLTTGLCLSPFKSLEECGFKGGTEERPEEAVVYYDYTLPQMDCPILNCDHYFTMDTCGATVGS